MPEGKASIHFRAVQNNSEAHNLRTEKLDYVHEDMIENNSSWSQSTIAEMESIIKRYCKEKSGRKLQKNSEPIREAVVNLHSGHTVEDLQKLSERLKSEFGMECFQIHIHRDEGLKQDAFGLVKINHHAHMLFRWQDMTTGKTLKLNRADLSKVQDVVAECLDMQRGELRVNSNTVRLEAVEYKRQQEQLRLDALQNQNSDLEQKKNEVRARIDRLKNTGTAVAAEEWRKFAEIINNNREITIATFTDLSLETIERAIRKISEFVEKQNAEIEAAEGEIRSLEKR